MQVEFFKFIFKSELIYIGERIKKGSYKPFICPVHQRYKAREMVNQILPLPYSTLIGAIKSQLGEGKNIHAIGKIMSPYERGYMAVTPYDTALNTAKLPITIEYLTNVTGEIYVKKNKDFNSLDLLGNELHIGGLKSKGFGKCEIISKKILEPYIIKGTGLFLSRIYYEENTLKQFGMSTENIIKPYFGYLFRKTSDFDGYYQRSIFENSIIKDGYNFLVEGLK